MVRSALLDAVDAWFAEVNEALPLPMKAVDALDVVSGETLDHGSIAFVLDNCYATPLKGDTVKDYIFMQWKKCKGTNPFTKQPIQRLIKIQVQIVNDN